MLVVGVLFGGGCRSTTTLVAAVACQGLSRPVQNDSADSWTFRGLTRHVQPRVRPGTYASSTYGVRFLDAEKLGPHGYWYFHAIFPSFACDRAVTLDHLKNGNEVFAFKLREPTRYHVTISYPDDWETLSDETRQEIGRTVAIEVGQHLAFVATTWHEILTWFGYRTRGYDSDFPSAFSWEDNYSNLLGTYVGAAALEDTQRPFSKAVTVVLSDEMTALVPQPPKRARMLTESVRGQWFGKRWLITKIRRRNLDLGLDDGIVSPVVVPLASDFCDAGIRPLAVPVLAATNEYGFGIQVEIEPREWERDRIWAALGVQDARKGRTLNPDEAFPTIMAFIAEEAVRRYALSL